MQFKLFSIVTCYKISNLIDTHHVVWFTRVISFAYPVKLSISTRSRVTKILEKKLYCEFIFPMQSRKCLTKYRFIRTLHRHGMVIFLKNEIEHHTNSFRTRKTHYYNSLVVKHNIFSSISSKHSNLENTCTCKKMIFALSRFKNCSERLDCLHFFFFWRMWTSGLIKNVLSVWFLARTFLSGPLVHIRHK